MARKKALSDERERPVNGKGAFKGFIQHNLTAEEKKAYDNWTLSPDDLWDAIERIIDNGYKLSTSHDDYNSTRQASLTCNNPKLPDYGWVLVARAPDSFNAIALIVFKHTVLLGENWTEFHARARETSSWG